MKMGAGRGGEGEGSVERVAASSCAFMAGDASAIASTEGACLRGILSACWIACSDLSTGRRENRLACSKQDVVLQAELSVYTCPGSRVLTHDPPDLQTRVSRSPGSRSPPLCRPFSARASTQIFTDEQSALGAASAYGAPEAPSASARRDSRVGPSAAPQSAEHLHGRAVAARLRTLRGARRDVRLAGRGPLF